MRGRFAIAVLLAFAPVACRRATAERPDARPTSITWRASVDLSSSKLSIEDARMSNRIDDVLARTPGSIAINGGFFGTDARPEGLAISGGKTLSGFSKAMSGGVLWVRDGMAHLTATEEYEAGAPEFAIQCRPRLVVGGRVNIRGDDGRRARRTALCVRDGGRTIEIAIAMNDDIQGGPTLFELATELAADGCEEALNLDGGPSTGYALRADAGRPFALPRGPVRHAIVVGPR